MKIIKCGYPWRIDNECSPKKTYYNWTVDTEVCRKHCPNYCEEYEKESKKLS